MTRLSDTRVQDALQRIKNRRKDGWLQQRLSEVEKVDASLNDMSKINENFDNMENLYKELDQKLEASNGENNQKIYKEIYSSFSKSLKEHMKILTDHAKEKIYEVQEK